MATTARKGPPPREAIKLTGGLGWDFHHFSGWHYRYVRCAGCLTVLRPHLHDGYCVDCYRARKALGL